MTTDEGASARMRTLLDGRPISALGFGCSSLWASPRYRDAAAQEMLEALVEDAVNHFDAGPSYGAGIGERRFAAFIARRGGIGFGDRVEGRHQFD